MWRMRSLARRLVQSSTRGPNASLSFLKPGSIFPRSYCAATETSIDSPGPSKVLHFRNLPLTVNENDLRTLVRPFGSVNNLLYLQKQALIQMETVEQAGSVIDHFSSEQPRLGNRNIFIQYSSHQEITPPELKHGKVLLVHIRNPLFDINVSVLHRVFSAYGNVQKICISQKNGPQGLVQFSSEESAEKARAALNGREIFDGCCRMDIGYSKTDDLLVRYTTEYARDFTDASLPAKRGYAAPKPSILGDGMVLADEETFHPSGVHVGYNRRRLLLVSNLNPEKIDEDKLFKLFSPYGKIIRIKMLYGRDKAVLQMGDGYQAELSVNYLRGTYLFGKRMEVVISKLGYLTHPNTRVYEDEPNNRFLATFARNCAPPNNILHAGNLPPDVDTDQLIEFLAPHPVVHVKLFNSLNAESKKQAFVEFKSIEDATEALVSKQFIPLGKLAVRLAFAKAATQFKESA